MCSRVDRILRLLFFLNGFMVRKFLLIVAGELNIGFVRGTCRGTCVVIELVRTSAERRENARSCEAQSIFRAGCVYGDRRRFSN